MAQENCAVPEPYHSPQLKDLRRFINASGRCHIISSLDGMNRGHLGANMITTMKFQGINALGEPLIIYANQTLLGKNGLGACIRFTADDRTKTVYGWNFSEGHHADTSRALNFNDTYSSLDFLRGAAQKMDGKFVFVASDFFKSFRRRLLEEDRIFLTAIFAKDWSWVDEYIPGDG